MVKPVRLTAKDAERIKRAGRIKSHGPNYADTSCPRCDRASLAAVAKYRRILAERERKGAKR